MQEFKPINKTSVSSAIVSQIVEMVKSGSLKPGDHIPTERRLCEMFCVGRGSVREAIKIMETMGILERQGKSVVVSKASEPNISEFSNMTKTIGNINNIIETRNIIETETCRLAAVRATPQDVENLWAITHQPIQDHVAFSTYDRSFHRAIVAAAHNPVLLQVYDLISDLIFRTEDIYTGLKDLSPEEQYAIVEENLQWHEDIIRAIDMKDRKQAAVRMQNHLKRAGENLIQSFSSSVKHSSVASKHDEQA